MDDVVDPNAGIKRSEKQLWFFSHVNADSTLGDFDLWVFDDVDMMLAFARDWTRHLVYHAFEGHPHKQSMLDVLDKDLDELLSILEETCDVVINYGQTRIALYQHDPISLMKDSVHEQ